MPAICRVVCKLAISTLFAVIIRYCLGAVVLRVAVPDVVDCTRHEFPCTLTGTSDMAENQDDKMLSEELYIPDTIGLAEHEVASYSGLWETRDCCFRMVT